MQNPFLTAEWRNLAMFNYQVSKELLMPYLPNGTELDLWNDTCYVSLIGFLFLNTKLKGFRIPFHSDFEEVNLRFYVRHNDGGEWKRGVVFIKEIVPKPALTFVANTLYGEHYQTMKMRHHFNNDNLFNVEYAWKGRGWNSIQLECNPTPRSIAIGSEEEFITEHYWGYTRITATKTSEYAVEHPRWDIYSVERYSVNVDFGDVYGDNFGFLQHQKPVSVFLAKGSPVEVGKGRAIS